MTYTKLAAKGVARPFVKWVGGKQQLMSQYKDLLPFTPTFLPEKYVEPMVGGGGNAIHHACSLSIQICLYKRY